MTHKISLPFAGGFVVRTLEVSDLTDAYLAWFNSDYVKRGLNISTRAFTLFDHMRHIEQCRDEGFLLLTIADAANLGLNCYLKVRFDKTHKLADFDLAMDRALQDRAELLLNASRVLMRHLFKRMGVAKVKLRINRANAAARLYADQSKFQLEGVLRSEVLTPNGKRDDILLYALFPEPK
ncbi:GNAT family protein [Xinfangfangia sp. CPCC 101601]|uniref:GNAT family protein n=1 Tax=Pseudogemmobacter lacusdianii TaxID=3069608 RepID=A0ABU0W192_9RHOB|nr:GNAT family protein [Xinfangfangia sp. CPCC 101601]MDQ2067782.1 GNAT family protein [Xinfangfangia sp. CPCC 101601]